MSHESDARLVTAHLSGDRAALAGIYDRYADALYDTAAAMVRDRQDAADVVQDVFLVAAERLEQLRDPDRLKSWLFAILRNEVYRRTRRKSRTVAMDFAGDVGDMALPPLEPTDTDRVEYQELAELVRAAAAGLSERDQLVLELSVRQGLEGDDLADALGVSAQQSYGLVHRMRQRTDRSLGALCVARHGRKNCSDLAQILDGWNGEFSTVVRKRVARHIDACETCDRSRRKVAPLVLFGSAPALAAPIELRDRVLGAVASESADPGYGFDAEGGFPSPLNTTRRAGLLLATVVVVLIATLAATVYAVSGDEPADAAVVAGAVEAPATVASLDAPTTTTAASTTSTAAPSTTTTEPVATTTTTTISPPLADVAPAEPAPPDPPPPAAPTTAPPTTAPPTTPPTPPPSTAPPTTSPPTTEAPASDPPRTAASPGVLSVSTTALEFGERADRLTLTLSNTGGQSLDWSASTTPASTPFTFLPATGTLAPGAALEVAVTFDRGWPGEGVFSASATIAATGTSADVRLSGTIERAPAIKVVEPGATACATQPLGFLVQISDDSARITADVTSTHRKTGTTFTAELVLTRSGWVASTPIGPIGGAPLVGLWDWTVTAADDRGNRSGATGATDVQTFHRCS